MKLRRRARVRDRATLRLMDSFTYTPGAVEQDMADMLDAVEWDWPRWGRRILVSGPWPATQGQGYWRVRIGKHSAILRELHRGY